MATSLASPVRATQKLTLILTNAQGTPVAQMDASGNVTYEADYRPYGQQQVGAPQAGPGYTGHVNDLDTGLVYMQARYYDPLVGRFLSIDPRGVYAGSVFEFAVYSYANQNPIRYLDPSGKVIHAVNSDDESRLLKWLNSKTTEEFAFDKNGNLYVKSKENNDTQHGSTKFTKSLIKAIKSSSMITVQIASTFQANGSTYKLSETGEGVTLGRPGGTLQEIFISGKSNNLLKDRNGEPLKDGPDWILTHELYGHAIPHILGPNTGNAIKNENQIRAQIPGAGRRAAGKDKE